MRYMLSVVGPFATKLSSNRLDSFTFGWSDDLQKLIREANNAVTSLRSVKEEDLRISDRWTGEIMRITRAKDVLRSRDNNQ